MSRLLARPPARTAPPFRPHARASAPLLPLVSPYPCTPASPMRPSPGHPYSVFSFSCSPRILVPPYFRISIHPYRVYICTRVPLYPRTLNPSTPVHPNPRAPVHMQPWTLVVSVSSYLLYPRTPVLPHSERSQLPPLPPPRRPRPLPRRAAFPRRLQRVATPSVLRWQPLPPPPPALRWQPLPLPPPALRWQPLPLPRLPMPQRLPLPRQEMPLPRRAAPCDVRP